MPVQICKYNIIYPNLLTGHLICHFSKLCPVAGRKFTSSIFISVFQNLLKRLIIEKASANIHNIFQIHIQHTAGILKRRLIRSPVILLNRINRGFIYNIHQNPNTQKGDKKHGKKNLVLNTQLPPCFLYSRSLFFVFHVLITLSYCAAKIF